MLHGGPAAPGDVAPLAGELGRWCHVLEPFQRSQSSEPLTVATHVQDLDDLIRKRCIDDRPTLVGHSWGAMLALGRHNVIAWTLTRLSDRYHRSVRNVTE